MRNKMEKRCLTRHKRLVSDGAHPNFYFKKTSFMMETLAVILIENKKQ